ncbi:hypothetical protein [Flavobacterium sp.]|uniref:hypothetical protein n=1 Tax=Flavobacterium sp. TaxID=239 RepID=UPI0025F0EF4D|nr:hypothetical protein [Flavobacterium sp.]
MKKIIFSIFLILAFNSYSQNRENQKLPVISENKGLLSNAIGWLKNESGQWIKYQNKIPEDLGKNQKLLENYNDHSIGVDNFISFEIKEVVINETKYILILKKMKDGYFKYETIKEGWVPNNSYEFYVLEPSEFAKIESVEHNKQINLDLKLKTYGKVSFISLKNLSNLKIANEINKSLNDPLNSFIEHKLALNVYCFDEKKIVQFYFFEYNGYKLENKDMYYETNYENFNKFIKINK